MARLGMLLFLVSGGIVAYFLSRPAVPISRPIKEEYYGPGKAKPDDFTVKPFQIKVPDEQLKDLKQRLALTKFVKPLEDSLLHYGVNGDYMKEVHSYWSNKYDWRRHEAGLNQFNHFKTEIGGLNIHFIRSKPNPSKKRVVPLLLVHGWPGSVYEFNKIIPMLTNPSSSLGAPSDFAFEVIAPSIPGYAWSDPASKKLFGPIACGKLFARLMERLSFEQYYMQGGDWGSLIVTNIARAFPERILGVHTNMAAISTNPGAFPLLTLKQFVGAWFPSLVADPKDHFKFYPLGEQVMFLMQETGYFHIQATKPDTIENLLHNFSDLKDGGLTKHFSMDDLLTNVMIYWTTDSITSSQRFYKECFREPEMQIYEATVVTVPSGFAMCRHELGLAPKSFLIHQFPNMTHYSDMDTCGHFAAFQEPENIARDVIKFVTNLL